MRHAQLVLLLAFVAMGSPACSDEGSSVVIASSAVLDGTYTNEYFGLSLSIPDGWAVASEESEQFIREAGSAVIGDNVMLKAAVEASKKTTFQMLSLSEFELGSAVESNPTLILMAERVSHLPGIRSGEDYLFHLGKAVLQTQLAYELEEEPQPVQLGNREWYRSKFVVDEPQISIHQVYYAAKHGDFVLVVILSAATGEQMAALERIADSIAL